MEKIEANKVFSKTDFQEDIEMLMEHTNLLYQKKTMHWWLEVLKVRILMRKLF